MYLELKKNNCGNACQVPANVETVDQMELLNKLLVAVGSVLTSSASPVHLAVACTVVWKLAESAGEPVVAGEW